VPDRLAENVLIDAIENISLGYANKYGRPPLNVSHWDPSDEFIRNLRVAVRVPKENDLVRYRYSYMVEERLAVFSKLGLVSTSTAGLFTENGSMSILAVANFLSAASVKHVHVLAPYYFITTHSLEKFGLHVSEIPHGDTRRDGSWPAGLKLGLGDALWITNPIYNTGNYFIEELRDVFLGLAESGVIIVLDETLAVTPTKLATSLVGHRNVLGIYTPHKSICLNRLKFSLIAFHLDYEDFFDDWGDVLFGGLSASATEAVSHFLSEDFDEYRLHFLALVDSTRSWHQDLLSRYGGGIVTDQNTRGHFISAYIPSIDSELGKSVRFLERVIIASGVAFIPGNRSGFDPALGLSFRVNFARDSAQFRGALHRLYSCLLTG
jgi:histidinol-phosphate/aromatic aminotransferase/cobyric acid decarboxylase-like protein